MTDESTQRVKFLLFDQYTKRYSLLARYYFVGVFCFYIFFSFIFMIPFRVEVILVSVHAVDPSRYLTYVLVDGVIIQRPRARIASVISSTGRSSGAD